MYALCVIVYAKCVKVKAERVGPQVMPRGWQGNHESHPAPAAVPAHGRPEGVRWRGQNSP